MLNILVTYFSKNGHTDKVAQRISENLRNHSTKLQRIRPNSEFSYSTWLFLSFFPWSRVPIQPLLLDLENYDLILLGTPKWSLSCPPFNEFLHRIRNSNGKNAAFFMTYGGFDERRYASQTIRELKKRGFNVVDSLMIKRRQVETGEYVALVNAFCRNLT